MAGENLVDLDELVLQCRDDQARQYIAEAVSCYKVGAFRSSIVATWIAVIFDFIYKLRELELSGDKNAKTKLDEFEKVRQRNDVTGSLNFEKQILDLSKDEFQLISPLEYADLSRLLDDRNRCAHPSMNSLEEIYQPSAELARYHLRNAVSYLLQRPPVQGKAAIDWLLNEVNSVYFPTSVEAARKIFDSGPLRRPTDALVRNLVIVLTKQLISGDLDESAERRYYAATNAVRQMHRARTEQTFSERLNDIFKSLPDERFGFAMRFLHFVPDTWQYVYDDVRIAMKTYVTQMPTEELVPNILVALQTEDLLKEGRVRLERVSRSEMAAIIEADIENRLGNELRDLAISMYEDAHNFYEANEIGKELLIPLVESFTDLDIERIIRAGQANNQIEGSFEFASVLKKIIRTGKIDETGTKELLIEHGLENVVARVIPEDAGDPF